MTTSQWSPEMISAASSLWIEGTAARVIAEQLGVNRNTLLGYAERHRDLFPRRRSGQCRSLGPSLTTLQPERAASWIGTRWVDHVRRETRLGAIVTMPRVTMIDGRGE